MSTEELQSLKDELIHWQNEVKRAEKEKNELLILKLDADQMNSEAQEEIKKLMDEEKEINTKHAIIKSDYEEEMRKFNKQNSDLKTEITRLLQSIQAVITKCKGASEEMKFRKDLPEKKVKFTHVEKTEDGDVENDKFRKICCQYCVATKIPFKLQGGQVLLTFEEEEVAQILTKKQRRTVNLDTEKVEVKYVPIPLTTGLKFEIHVTISRNEVLVSQLPDYVPAEAERLRDKLELHFSKSNIGGGEIDSVQLHEEARTSTVTFRDSGVAQHVAKRRKHTLRNSTNAYEVAVSPHIEKHLEKLQTFSGVARRTILLTDMRKLLEEDETVQDMIEIFFQKPSNGGGEIQHIKYLSDGHLTAYFEEEDTKVE